MEARRIQALYENHGVGDGGGEGRGAEAGEIKKTATSAKAKQKTEDMVWVLTDIIRYARQDTTENIHTDEYVLSQYRNSGTSFLRRQTITVSNPNRHTMSRTDYSDPSRGGGVSRFDRHDGVGEFVEAEAKLSPPPEIIGYKERVTINVSVAFTDYTTCREDYTAYAGISMGKPGQVPSVGEYARNYYRFIHVVNSPHVAFHKEKSLKRSGDLTFVFQTNYGIPSNPGEQKSLYLRAMDMQTEYVYTWTPRSEAKVEKITPREEVIK